MRVLLGVVVLCLLVVNLVPTCTGTPATITLGFVYSNDSSDGWTLQHQRARGDLDRTLTQLNIASFMRECFNCVTEPGSFLTLVDQWMASGLDMLFLTSGSHGPFIVQIKAKYPNLPVLVWGGPSVGNNTIAPAQLGYQAYFLAGMACGFQTRTNSLGYGALGSLTRNTYNQIAAFTLGAASVNPAIFVHVIFSPNFYYPVAEQRSMQSLIDKFGVDCGVSTVDGAKALVAANRTTVGFNNDLQYLLGPQALVSVLPVWSDVYIQAVTGWLFNQTLKGVTVTGGIGKYIDLSAFSAVLKAEARVAITAKRLQMINNTFDVFCDPTVNAKLGVANTTGCLSLNQIFKISKLLPGLAANDYNLTDSEIYENLFVGYAHPVSVVLLVFGSLGVLTVVLGLLFLVKHRRTYVVRATSPIFTGIIVIGAFMQILAGFTWIGAPTFSTCQSRVWLFGLGFVLSMATLFAKNYRIYKIFSNDSFEIQPFTDQKVALFSLAPLAPAFLILGLWTGLDPFLPRFETNNDLLNYQRYFKCGSNASWGLAVGLTYLAVLLAFDVTIAWLTRGKTVRGLSTPDGSDKKAGGALQRRLNKSNFTESREIQNIAAIVLLVALVGVGVNMGNPGTVFFEATFNGLIQIFMGLLIVVFLVGPKVYKIVVLKEWDSYEERMTSTAVTSGAINSQSRSRRNTSASRSGADKTKAASSDKSSASVETQV